MWFLAWLSGTTCVTLTLPVGTSVKWDHCQWPRRRQWHPTPVLLAGKSHGRRSLEGCSPWGRWGSGTTERLHFHFSLSCIGEGHGNPLQCSCLENPRDGGAWWAAVYGVTQSQRRLKWLSSSSQWPQCLLSSLFQEGIFVDYLAQSRCCNTVTLCHPRKSSPFAGRWQEAS